MANIGTFSTLGAKALDAPERDTITLSYIDPESGEVKEEAFKLRVEPSAAGIVNYILGVRQKSSDSEPLAIVTASAFISSQMEEEEFTRFDNFVAEKGVSPAELADIAESVYQWTQSDFRSKPPVDSTGGGSTTTTSSSGGLSSQLSQGLKPVETLTTEEIENFLKMSPGKETEPSPLGPTGPKNRAEEPLSTG